MRTVFALALTLASAGVVYGQDSQSWRWREIDSGEHVMVYVDTVTFEWVGNGKVAAWILMDFAKPQVSTGGDVFTQGRNRFLFDCSGGASKLLDMALYSEDGKVVSSASTPADEQPWQHNIPGTIGETMTVRSCLLAYGLPIEYPPQQ